METAIEFATQFGKAKDLWKTLFTKDELEKFNAIAFQVCRADGLAKDNASPAYYRSLFWAIHTIATLGLKPGKQYGHFDLHIEKDEVICRPMYQGYLEIAYRDPDLIMVKADVVREGESFTDNGVDKIPTHSKGIAGEGKIIGAYAVAQYKDGFLVREILTTTEMNKIKQHIIDRSFKRMLSKLATDWEEEWAKVKVIRRLLKSLRRSFTIEEQAVMNELDNKDYNLEVK